MSARTVPRAGVQPVVGALAGVDGTRLHWSSWPVESPRARVVVVHGFGEHSGRYLEMAETLAARGYAVLAYDQRGHGRSEGRRGHVARFDLLTEDLSLVAAHAQKSLPGVRAPYLYGHSMGALVVLRALQTIQVKAPGVILSAPWLGTATPIPLWKRRVASVLRRVAPSVPLRTALDAGALTSDPEMQRAYLEDPLVGHAISVRFYDAVCDAQERALADGGTGMPTLLLIPLADSVTDLARTRAWARNAADELEVLELPGMRHEPHNERARAEVLRAIADWLDDRTRGTGDG